MTVGEVDFAMGIWLGVGRLWAYVTNGDTNFELKSALIIMVQASPFFLEKRTRMQMLTSNIFFKICSTFTIKEVIQEAIGVCAL